VQTGLVFHTHDTTICQKFTSPFRGAAVKIVTPKTHENRHHVLGLFGTLHWILTKMACQLFLISKCLILKPSGKTGWLFFPFDGGDFPA
jgi:hypothetical protein